MALDQTASRLIEKHGRTITLRRSITSGQTKAHDPTSGTSTDTDYTATAVFDLITDERFNGALVEAGDRLVFVAAKDLSITPKATDTMIDGADTLNIVSVKTVMPGNTAFLYELLVRG